VPPRESVPSGGVDDDSERHEPKGFLELKLFYREDCEEYDDGTERRIEVVTSQASASLPVIHLNQVAEAAKLGRASDGQSMRGYSCISDRLRPVFDRGCRYSE